MASLWLDAGLELGFGELSRLLLFGLDSIKGGIPPMVCRDPPYPLRLLAVELPLLRPGPTCALHLLLTLSERLSIALCTNPPSPFVGDAGRSVRSGDIRP